MLFHIEILVRDTVSPADALAGRKTTSEAIAMIMKSGKVKDSGNYADARGGYYIIDIDSPKDLKRLIAPILDIASVNAHPILSMDDMQKLFQEMAK
jgi:hypothetical protein